MVKAELHDLSSLLSKPVVNGTQPPFPVNFAIARCKIYRQKLEGTVSSIPRWKYGFTVGKSRHILAPLVRTEGKIIQNGWSQDGVHSNTGRSDVSCVLLFWCWRVVAARGWLLVQAVGAALGR